MQVTPSFAVVRVTLTPCMVQVTFSVAVAGSNSFAGLAHMLPWGLTGGSYSGTFLALSPQAHQRGSVVGASTKLSLHRIVHRLWLGLCDSLSRRVWPAQARSFLFTASSIACGSGSATFKKVRSHSGLCASPAEERVTGASTKLSLHCIVYRLWLGLCNFQKSSES